MQIEGKSPLRSNIYLNEWVRDAISWFSVDSLRYNWNVSVVSETREPSNSLCDKTVHFSMPATSYLTQILMYRLTYLFHILIVLLFRRLIFLGHFIIFKISSNISQFINFFLRSASLFYLCSVAQECGLVLSVLNLFKYQASGHPVLTQA